MFARNHLAGAFFSLTLVIAMFGCNSGPRMAPVKGTVTYDDKPIAKGTIRFESPGYRPSTGKIINGEIVEMTTTRAGDGVPVGAHKIAVWATEDADSAVVPNPGESKVGANYMSGKSLIRVDYNNPDTSGLTAEIKPGENVLAFKLHSDPAKAGK